MRELVILCAICAAVPGFGKPANCDVYPASGVSIKGIDKLERSKYINIAGSAKEIKNVVLPDQKRFNYYFDTLDMSLGRRLSVVGSESKWGGTVREDPARPGHADIEFLKKRANGDDNGMEPLKEKFGARDGIAAHDSHNAYPKFFKLYSKDDNKTFFPEDSDAAAELAANVLKYSFTDFQRPVYYEPVNEPGWQYTKDPRFTGYHVAIKKAVDKANIGVKVGGPCNSVSYYYKKNYSSLNTFTSFIDATNNELDFYSFHTYDYMKFDPATRTLGGSITSGLPLEGVFDALASYTFNKYGKELSYVASEHGAYISDHENRELMFNTLMGEIPEGEEVPFSTEMKRRSIANMVVVNGAIANTMVFMDNPHIVLKAVPFILVESSKWDPRYYASLLVRKNFDKNSREWVESDLIYFYKFFKDVKGKMIRSFCSDADIQHHAYLDGERLVLLFHNLSDVKKSVNINLKEFEGNVDTVKIRRLYPSARNYSAKFTDRGSSSYTPLVLKPQESAVVSIYFKEPVEIAEKLDMKIFYASEQGVSFTGARDFILKLPKNIDAKSAVLRVGVNSSTSLDSLKISFNGTPLEVVPDASAPRYTSEGNCTSTKIIEIPVESLKEENRVTVDFGQNTTGGVGGVVMRVLTK